MALPITRKFLTRLAVSTRIATLLRNWCAASLPAQSVTSVVAHVLGPRHAHQVHSPAVGRTDPMAGWRDFRRAHYDHPTEGSFDGQAAHALAHAAGQRHHHDPSDTSVENLETTGGDDGAASGTASVSAVVVFVAAAESVWFEAVGLAIGECWPAQRDARFRSAETRRLERPPQRLG